MDTLAKIAEMEGNDWDFLGVREEFVEDKAPDMVNKPPHYTNRRYEVIDMMLAIYGKEAVINYCELNAFKYRMRAGYKGSPQEDINKAIWYENKAKAL